MNIFKKFEDILGKENPKDFNLALQEFFQLTAEIKVKLGGKAYLVDKYVSYLLAASKELWSHEVGDNAFTDGEEFQNLCKDVVIGGSDYQSQPAYEQTKAYLAANPIPFQENLTKSNILMTMMIGEFMESEMKKNASRQHYRLLGVMEFHHLADLYGQITDILGSELLMEKLNLVIRQRFFIVPVMAAYVQGVTNALLIALNYRDLETGKQIFQLVMERGFQVGKGGGKDA